MIGIPTKHNPSYFPRHWVKREIRGLNDRLFGYITRSNEWRPAGAWIPV